MIQEYEMAIEVLLMIIVLEAVLLGITWWRMKMMRDEMGALFESAHKMIVHEINERQRIDTLTCLHFREMYHRIERKLTAMMKGGVR